MTSTLSPNLPADRPHEQPDNQPDHTGVDVPDAPDFGLRGRVAQRVVKRILRGVPVTARLAGGETYGALAPGHPEIRIDEPHRFFARLSRSPMIGLGESYMAGEWRAAEGTDLADALSPFAERLTDLIKPVFYRMRHVVLPRGLNPRNSKSGSKQNIEAHYDLSNEMFEQFLDPSLSYSSARFATLDPAPGPEDLEVAQIDKTDAILDRAGVTAGSRVLEIGTGWGTLAIRAAQRGARVTSITLSGEQAELARTRVEEAGVSDRVEIAVRDYRDQAGEFDAVVSVEMVEAVGEEYWPTYFAAIDKLLAPGGKVAIQAILIDHDRLVATRDTYTWIHKYIFPGGMLPSTQAIGSVLARHTSMRVTGVDEMGQHYGHTLRLWRERFLANWPRVSALGFDETFRRMWEFYLAYCEAGFRTGYLQVAQISLGR